MKLKIKPLLQMLFLIAVDLAAFYVSLFLAVWARTNLVHLFVKGAPTFTFSFQYLVSMWWIPAVFIFIIQLHRLYFTRFPFWEETRNLVKAIVFSVVIVLFVIYVRGMFTNIVFRALFVFLILFGIIVFPVFRFFGKKILFKLGVWKENVIILGAGENAISTIKGLVREEHIGYNVVGFLDDDPKKIGSYVEVNGKKYKIYGEIENFIKFVDILKIQAVFISVDYDTEKLTHLINSVHKYVRRVIIIPDLKGVSIFNSELHYLFTEKLFMINVHNSLHSSSNVFIKRAFDLIVSIFGFILISPIFLILMGLVKFTSRGPVFFKHTRIGKDGKIFGALKFRSMYKDAEERIKYIIENDPQARAEWEENYKLKNDPRITPVGKFLRRTSLDELPQILNIIAGKMSLVGPRPVIREEIDKFYGDFKDYYYMVRPGLTGLWQVSGRSDTDYEFRVQTDVWYVQNWSLWLDIIILLRTPMAVFKAKGAY
jgi:undecaprenyl-phosphate galactose phosphotransferase